MEVTLRQQEEEPLSHTTTTYAAESLSPRHFLNNNLKQTPFADNDQPLESVPEEEDEDEVPKAAVEPLEAPPRLSKNQANQAAPMVIPKRTSNSGLYPDVPKLSQESTSQGDAGSSTQPPEYGISPSGKKGKQRMR